MVMVDVGPQMSEHLVHLRKSLFLLAESKVGSNAHCRRPARDVPDMSPPRVLPALPCPALAAVILPDTRNGRCAVRHDR